MQSCRRSRRAPSGGKHLGVDLDHVPGSLRARTARCCSLLGPSIGGPSSGSPAFQSASRLSMPGIGTGSSGSRGRSRACASPLVFWPRRPSSSRWRPSSARPTSGLVRRRLRDVLRRLWRTLSAVPPAFAQIRRHMGLGLKVKKPKAFPLWPSAFGGMWRRAQAASRRCGRPSRRSSRSGCGRTSFCVWVRPSVPRRLGALGAGMRHAGPPASQVSRSHSGSHRVAADSMGLPTDLALPSTLLSPAVLRIATLYRTATTTLRPTQRGGASTCSSRSRRKLSRFFISMARRAPQCGGTRHAPGPDGVLVDRGPRRPPRAEEHAGSAHL